MRVPIAYYLMLLYCTVMFKPLIPIVKDTISHTFAEAIHIATVHAIYGANHLQKEISQEEKESNRSNSLSVENSVLVHIPVSELQFDFDLYNSPNNYPAKVSQSIPAVLILKAGPPPKDL